MGTLVGLNTVKGIQEAKQIKQNKKNDTTRVAVRCADIAENAISDVHCGKTGVREDIIAAEHVDANPAASLPVFENCVNIPNSQNGPNVETSYQFSKMGGL